MKKDPTIENKKEFKILSMMSRKAIIKDKLETLKNNVEVNMKNPKQLWNTAKDSLYGEKKLILQRELWKERIY